MAVTKLYSTGCPRCKILAKRLDAAGIEYDVIDDMDEIMKACKAIGTDMVPVLGNDYDNFGIEYMDFDKAMKWAGEQIK